MTTRPDAQTYTPPKGVQEAAARAVAWIEQGKAGSGFTPTGRARAGQLSRGEAVSLDIIERMDAYFRRHAGDARAQGFDAGEAGYPTPGRVAWDAWGGDAGMRWATAILDEIKRKAERDAARQDDAQADAPAYRVTTATLRLDDASPYRHILRAPERLSDGAWRLDALAAVAGEPKTYPHGQEQIPAEELVAAAPRFAGIPVTAHHPSRGHVTPDDDRTHVGDPAARGDIVEGARVLGARLDGPHLVVTLAMPDIPTVAGVSVGWLAGRIDPSTSPPSQRDLTPDHLALTPTPRVPGAGLRLDANGGKTMKIMIAGKEYDLPDDAANAIKAEMDTLRADKLPMQAELDRIKGASEAMDAKRADAKRADAMRADAIAAEVRQRVALVVEVKPHVSPEVAARLDSMSPADIHRAALQKLRPTLILDGKSPDCLAAAYAIAIGDAAERERAKGQTQADAARLDDASGKTKPKTPIFGVALDSKYLTNSRKEA